MNDRVTENASVFVMLLISRPGMPLIWHGLILLSSITIIQVHKMEEFPSFLTAQFLFVGFGPPEVHMANANFKVPCGENQDFNVVYVGFFFNML